MNTQTVNGLSDPQKLKLTCLFHVLDFNHDGFIQPDDFDHIAENTALIKALRMEEQDVESVRIALEKCWTEMVGLKDEVRYKISLQDWLTLAENFFLHGEKFAFDQSVDQVVDTIFKYFDDNHDSHLNIVEYMSLLISHRSGVRDADKSFQLMDTNGDNLLSREEMSSAVKSFFLSGEENSPGNWLFGNWRACSTC